MPIKNNRRITSKPLTQPYDRYLLLALISVILLGLLMVSSASIVISNKLYQQPFHYLFKQLSLLAVGAVMVYALLKIEIEEWYQLGPLLLLAAGALLILVLIPGIGHQVNGSMRWLNLGILRLQVSEIVKLFVIIYLAGYIVRHTQELQQQVTGFLKPMLLLGVIALLLLCQPDFGATVVIVATALGMLFLGGVRLWQFALLLIAVLSVLAVLAISSPYRLQRLTTFLQPWANQFDSGYQLTQSLIAFGRGGWFGVGLGESIQKLFYLPEAHTDFLFAVLAEELGLLGVLMVMLLFAVIVARGFIIARTAYRQTRWFASYLAYGLSLWLALQVAINLGVNAGVLPTKGLTLPFMSYGGSSLLVSCMLAALLLRIDYENRVGGLVKGGSRGV